MAIDTLPPAPVPGSSTFDADVLAYLIALSTVTPQMNAAILALNNNSTNATSTTSVAMGTGNKTLTVQANKSYVVGHSVRIASTANGAVWMEGDVTAYNTSTGSLTVAVARTQGSGTLASWTVSLSPASLNLDRKGTAVASAASPNIWAGDGNTVHLTGTTNVTGFAAAPSAGMRQKVVLDGAIKFVASANLVLPGGVDYQGAADDILDVYADTTTKFYVEIRRASGRAVLTQQATDPWRYLMVNIASIYGIAGARAVDLAMTDAAGNGMVVSNFSPGTTAALNAAVGAGGIDATATFTAGQIWYLYGICAADGGSQAHIYSRSANAPALPSGYTHYAYLACTTIGSTTNPNVIGLSKFNNRVAINGLVLLVDGTITANAWTGLSLYDFIPCAVSASLSRGAKSVHLAFGGTGVHMGLRQFNAYNTSYLPAAFYSGAIGGTSQAFGTFVTARAKWITADVPIYANDLGGGIQYYSDTTTGTICILGWEE